MKRSIIVLIILLNIMSFNSIAQEITFQQDSLPTLTLTAPVKDIVKIAVAQIKAKDDSKITINGDFEYNVQYDGSYTVVVWYPDAGIDNYQSKTLFESTRVADVRLFMSTELSTFFENY